MKPNYIREIPPTVDVVVNVVVVNVVVVLVVVVLVVLVSAMSAIIIRLSLSLAIQTMSDGSQVIFILDLNGFRLPKLKKNSKSVSFSGLNRLLRQKRNNFEIIQERVSFATG